MRAGRSAGSGLPGDKPASRVGSRTGPVALVTNRSPRLTSARRGPWRRPTPAGAGCLRGSFSRREQRRAVDAFLTLISGISPRTFQGQFRVHPLTALTRVPRRHAMPRGGLAHPRSLPINFRHVEVLSLSVTAVEPRRKCQRRHPPALAILRPAVFRAAPRPERHRSAQRGSPTPSPTAMRRRAAGRSRYIHSRR